MVLAGNRYTWLDFASAGTRANIPPAHDGAGNSLTTGSDAAVYSRYARLVTNQRIRSSWLAQP